MTANLLALVGVQYAFNVVTKHLDVRYEWRRIGGFAMLYVAIAIAGLWPRNLSLPVEVMGSCAAAVLVVLTVYALFTEEERLLTRELVARMMRAGRREVPVTVVPDGSSGF